MCRATPGGVVVGTDCLYPSNSVVLVEVTGDGSYTVSDSGGAVDVLSEHGVTFRNIQRALGPFAKSHGLTIGNDGALFISHVGIDLLPFMIIHVANASKTAADVLLERHRFTQFDQLREEIARVLEFSYRGKFERNREFVGRSNKKHIFEYAVRRYPVGHIAINIVMDDGNSINSAVVSTMDIRLKEDPLILPRIIYDDRMSWRSESLQLLEEGAPTIGFTHIIPALNKLTRNSEFATQSPFSE